ncbi:MAG: heparinase II/III family protein [Planctomycetaceae bacterium]
MKTFYYFLFALCVPIGGLCVPDDRVLLAAESKPDSSVTAVGGRSTLVARSGTWSETVIEGVDAAAETFSIEAQIDPVEAVGGDLQVVSGFVVGMRDGERLQDGLGGQLRVDLREGAERASFNLWHRETSLTMQQPGLKPAGWMDNRDYQHPNELPSRDGLGRRVKLVAWPDGEGSRVRLFVDYMDRPLEEHVLTEQIRAGVVKLFTMRGGQEVDIRQTSLFSDVAFRKLTIDEARELPSMVENVLDAINGDHPAMRPVAAAIKEGRTDEARSLLLQHMRTRTEPMGPTIDEVASVVLHPNWQKISDEAVAGRYATIGYFDGFVDAWRDTNNETHPWVLQQEPLQLNWARDNGHLNRHFHWVSMARAWQENHDPKYVRQFSAEVLDWVSREPFFWDRCPTVGGLNLMDGTTFRWGYMNTSNIGRRLELTWWPAYEVFRDSPDFSDEAHVALLLGMLRQARLIMNPTSFAAHDDGGAHTTLALMQTALMLPEFKESAAWKQTAMQRWDVILARQFHPDGSHVSLSTGYNWASLTALENYLRLYQRFGETPPAKALATLEQAAEHPMLLTGPNQGQMDLNDGGWSTIEDRYQSLLTWFPDRKDFQWMATKGAKGSPPDQRSVYFPNAGHYVMRTGWGPEEKYLFFGAGPWGASHGKFDALNIYAQFGNQVLIRNAGRGSYSGIGNTKHAGRSLSFNTLSPDWAQENSIPHWKHDMAIGFVPPKRRWISNDHFDYGEGAFNYGWYNSTEHIQGKWLRQVVFVKGKDARTDGYFVVIDTVEPRDDKPRTWRHPSQLGLNASNIAIRESDRSSTAIGPDAALKILPVGEMNVSIIQGQEQPELLGWRIYDTIANPWPVPTYQWQDDGTFCRAWVIQMSADESAWPVESVSLHPTNQAGEIHFTIHRRDGGHDHVLRRFPGQPPTEFQGETITGDLVVDCIDSTDQHFRLEIIDGEESVAKPSHLVNAAQTKASSDSQ